MHRYGRLINRAKMRCSPSKIDKIGTSTVQKIQPVPKPIETKDVNNHVASKIGIFVGGTVLGTILGVGVGITYTLYKLWCDYTGSDC